MLGETCSLTSICAKINDTRFIACFNSGWYLDHDRKCSTRSSIVRSRVATENVQVVEKKVVNPLDQITLSPVRKQSKTAFVRELFSRGTTLSAAIQEVMQVFSGTSFSSAENCVWGYFYEMRKQGRVTGDKEGIVHVT